MVTLKIIKSISPVCDVKSSNRAFCHYVANGQLWGSFLLKVKIKRKRKLDSLLFYGEKNSKAFENYCVIRPESPPLKKNV